MFWIIRKVEKKNIKHYKTKQMKTLSALLMFLPTIFLFFLEKKKQPLLSLYRTVSFYYFKGESTAEDERSARWQRQHRRASKDWV